MGSGAGSEGALALDVMVKTDMTDVSIITIACMDVVLELRMWHSTGMAGGGGVVGGGWSGTTTTDC